MSRGVLRPTSNMIKYSELIKQEKENPQKYFNKTFACSKCGHCEYEAWEKVGGGEFINDGRNEVKK